MTWTWCSASPSASPCWSTVRSWSRASPTPLPAMHGCAPSISARVAMADLLTIQGLSAGYGRAVVLSDIALRLGEGEAPPVLGRNGMGKTTLIDSLVGVTRRFAGSVNPHGPDAPT